MRTRTRATAGVLALIGCASCGSDSGAGGSGNSLSLDSHFFQGTYQISGTVTFRDALPAGTGVQLILTDASSLPSGALTYGNELKNGSVGATSTIAWRVGNLAPGKYLVALVADTSGDGHAGAGDVGGLYDGSADHPFQDKKDAKPIVVAAASLDSLDFGAGPLVCKKAWGDPCTADGECRGASCVYGSGLRVRADPGTCTSGRCAAKGVTCSPIRGGAGTVEPNDCFGEP